MLPFMTEQTLGVCERYNLAMGRRGRRPQRYAAPEIVGRGPVQARITEWAEAPFAQRWVPCAPRPGECERATASRLTRPSP